MTLQFHTTHFKRTNVKVLGTFTYYSSLIASSITIDNVLIIYRFFLIAQIRDSNSNPRPIGGDAGHQVRLSTRTCWGSEHESGMVPQWQTSTLQ